MVVEILAKVLRYKISENMLCWDVLLNSCWHARKDPISSASLQGNTKRPFWISTANTINIITTGNKSSKVRKSAHPPTPSLASSPLSLRNIREACSQDICLMRPKNAFSTSADHTYLYSNAGRRVRLKGEILRVLLAGGGRNGGDGIYRSFYLPAAEDAPWTD